MADEGIYIDAHNLEELGRDSRRAAEHVRSETDKTVWEVGAELAATAKEIASQHSKTIAGTIRFRPAPGMAIVSAGDAHTPIAALEELGNKGSRRSSTSFRHPVFGNRDVWVTQDKHPFLAPALKANRTEITRRMERTWDRALGPYRLRPEG